MQYDLCGALCADGADGVSVGGLVEAGAAGVVRHHDVCAGFLPAAQMAADGKKMVFFCQRGCVLFDVDLQGAIYSYAAFCRLVCIV